MSKGIQYLAVFATGTLLGSILSRRKSKKASRQGLPERIAGQVSNRIQRRPPSLPARFALGATGGALVFFGYHQRSQQQRIAKIANATGLALLNGAAFAPANRTSRNRAA